jgi:hypothetical protein
LPRAAVNGGVPEESKKQKKKKSAAEMQKELRDLAKPDPNAPQKPPVDLKKIFTRLGLVMAVLWIVAVLASYAWKSYVPYGVIGVLTLVVIGAGIWVSRFMKKQQALGALLQGADTEEGRKAALEKLAADYKPGDTQATLARAQLEMQEDPKKALATLESINLSKQLGPVADQVRSMRAMIHLTLGETKEARALVDAMEMGKQEDVKTRAMFAAVAAETWGRTGQAKKAIEMLDIFNAEDPELSEMRVQLWRARAFAYAGNNDMKGASRALKKLADMNPQLLGMFAMGKKVHPILQHEAKQLLMKSGAVQRKLVRQRM